MLILFYCKIVLAQVATNQFDYSLIENNLKENLHRQTSKSGQVLALLELSSHYVYKGGENTEDLTQSKQYALKAYNMSLTNNYLPGKNKALILLADAFLESEQPDSAKKLLPLVADTSRIDILASICRHYVSIQEGGNWADSSVLFINEARKLSVTTGYLQKEIYCTGLFKTACTEALRWHAPDVALVNSIDLSYHSKVNNTVLLHLLTEAQAALRKLQLRRQAAAEREQDIFLMKQNNALLKKDAEIRQASLNSAKFLRNVTITGILLLATILILVYNQYTNKKKNNLIIQQKNDELQKLLGEKEWLLKEIHHRVKNNLQTIVSLLESQSANLNDDALLAIRDSQNRVYAMSLIHQKLYQTNNVATTNMATYLPELVQYISESFTTKNQICFQLQVSPIELDVVQAVPVGLIVNEAITNAIKYAFRNGGKHEVHIEMEIDKNNNVSLYICDNGVGLPADFDSKEYAGLGLKLINGLSEDLKGKFKIWTDKGTHLTIHFTAGKGMPSALSPQTNQTTLQTA